MASERSILHPVEPTDSVGLHGVWLLSRRRPRLSIDGRSGGKD